MKINLNIPWKRYALIAHLAKKSQGKSPQFGKTVLQKLVYLLQEAYGIDCGYEFSLYTYGPFSSELLQDLDLVEHFGGVNIYPVVSGTGGYSIQPGPHVDELCEKVPEFFKDVKVENAISLLIKNFGECLAKELELYSTIVYVENDMRNSTSAAPSRREIAHVVQQIKPKFSGSEILEGVHYLQKMEFIHPCD